MSQKVAFSPSFMDEADEWTDVSEIESLPTKYFVRLENKQREPVDTIEWRYRCNTSLLAFPLFRAVYNLLKEITVLEPPIPHFRGGSPVVLLGRSFPCVLSFPNSKEYYISIEHPSMDAFLVTFREQTWFTYRCGFSPLPGSTFTSDSGWGCTIRCFQMLMAQTLQSLDTEKGSKYERIQLFTDSNSPKYPFSIHNIIKEAEKFHLFAGDWFDPARTSKIFQKIVSKAAVSFQISICKNSSLIRQQILSEATQGLEKAFQPTVLFLPIRTSLHERLPSCYREEMKFLLSHPFSLGLIGGSENSALYFIGYHRGYVLSLDPHFVHKVTEIEKEVYHMKYPKFIPMRCMSSSILISFLVKSEEDLEVLCRDISLHNEEIDPISTLIFVI